MSKDFILPSTGMGVISVIGYLRMTKLLLYFYCMSLEPNNYIQSNSNIVEKMVVANLSTILDFLLFWIFMLFKEIDYV